MGAHYTGNQLYSAVNSLAYLRVAVPYSQKFIIARFIIAGGNCNSHGDVPQLGGRDFKQSCEREMHVLVPRLRRAAATWMFAG